MKNNYTLTRFQDSAGIRIPPNLARILVQWGLGEQMMEKAIKCERLAFRQRTSTFKNFIFPKIIS